MGGVEYTDATLRESARADVEKRRGGIKYVSAVAPGSGPADSASMLKDAREEMVAHTE